MDVNVDVMPADPQSIESLDEDVDRQQPAEENASSSGSDSDEDEEDDEDEDEAEAPQIEWLVTSRQKRSTAGNRLHALLQDAEEDPEDELALLFNEDDAGDDAGFEDAGRDSDVQMDSSSDDEDAAADDDLEGEKALQKQERAEKQAKKRKMQDRIPFVKKRVKLDPMVPQAPAPRPKKKSERASWIPTTEDLPTRASARGTTRQSKEQLHAQMVDREIKRIKQLKNMEKAAAAKKAREKPAMTQADRLAEAARIEKANSRSLSRWEEAEMQREEEQKAKLAALKNRHLEGPVITWWSGLAEWVGGRLRQVGKNLTIEEPKEKPATKKRKAGEMEEESEKGKEKAEKEAVELPETETVEVEAPKEGSVNNETLTKPPVDADKESSVTVSLGPSIQEPETTTPKPAAAISSISTPDKDRQEEEYPPPIQPQVHLPPRSSVLAPPPGLPIQAPHPPPNFNKHSYSQHQYTLAPPPALDGSAPLPGLGYGYNFHPPPPPPHPSVSQPPPPPQNQTGQLGSPPQPAQPEQPPPPPAIEHAARNYLILQNFEDSAIKDKNVQTEIIFGRKFQKLPASKTKPHHPVCCITHYPAKYRDPSTGLAYANAFAYAQIQKLKRGEYKWSKLVGAYVGQGTGVVARGVPGRFKDGKGERETPKEPPREAPREWKAGVSLGQALREGAGAGTSGNGTGSSSGPIGGSTVGGPSTSTSTGGGGPSTVALGPVAGVNEGVQPKTEAAPPTASGV